MSLTCEEKQARLAAVEAAWDAYVTGGAWIRMRFGEKEIQRSEVDAKLLQKELEYWRDAVAACLGTDRLSRRAFQFVPY